VLGEEGEEGADVARIGVERVARGAALVVMLSVLVSVLTFYYLYATARATREARR